MFIIPTSSPNEADSPQQTRGQVRNYWPLRDFLLWLALIPLVVVLLLVFSQLALKLHLGYPGAVTRTMLNADYGPWGYETIPGVDFAALAVDILREEEVLGTEVSRLPDATVESGVFWVPPTATPTDPAVQVITSTPTLEEAVVTVSPGPAITITTNPVTRTPTRQPTLTIPASTPTPTATRTVVIILPTRTFTPEPPQPTLTSTPVTPSVTPSATVSNTPEPVIPTNTPVTPSPEPLYAPVWPLAENSGVSEQYEGGCRAYFGYLSENPGEVDIPAGDTNYLNIPLESVTISPGLPTHFYVGRVEIAFSVVWHTNQTVTWTLQGREASAEWCLPPQQ